MHNGVSSVFCCCFFHLLSGTGRESVFYAKLFVDNEIEKL